MSATLVGWLTRHGAAVLAVGVFAGLALPGLAGALRPLLPASVVGLLLAALLRIEWQRLFAHMARPLLIALVLVWLLAGSALAALAAARLLGLPAGLAAAVVLMAASPPIVSGPAIALLVGLDAALMLALTVVGTLVAPFTLAAVPALLTGAEFELTPLALLARLAALIGGCFAGAWLLRRGLGAARLAAWRGGLDLVSVLLLLLFAVAVMDGVAGRIAAEPGYTARFVVAAFAANLALQGGGAALFARLGRREALTVAFASGNRNMALMLAVLPAGGNPDVLLFFALGQFPIYLLPAALAPLYRRLLPAAR